MGDYVKSFTSEFLEKQKIRMLDGKGERMNSSREHLNHSFRSASAFSVVLHRLVAAADGDHHADGFWPE